MSINDNGSSEEEASFCTGGCITHRGIARTVGVFRKAVELQDRFWCDEAVAVARRCGMTVTYMAEGSKDDKAES